MPDDGDNDGRTAFLPARGPAPSRPANEEPKSPETMPDVPLVKAVPGMMPPSRKGRVAIPIQALPEVAQRARARSAPPPDPPPEAEPQMTSPPTVPRMGGNGARSRPPPEPEQEPRPVEPSTNPSPERRETLTTEQPGRYVLRKEFGRGGQSVVWLALDQHIGREIAFKQLLPQNSDVRAGASQALVTVMQARFVREARITGQLEHPSIVPVYEVGRRGDGSLYYTQKLVRGRTLTAAMKDAKTMRERLALLSHYVDLCQAIAYAHRRGVIHRDIKPDNVMVGEFGETVVLDWGLARARGQAEISEGEEDLAQTQEGDVLGTPAYMSPEQAMGSKKDVNEQSDVWALGAVLYEILTGRPPFQGRNLMAMLMAVAKDPIPLPRTLRDDAPAELAAVAMKALTRDKSKRYKSARELVQEIDSFRTGQRVSAYKYTPWHTVRRWVKRNRTVAIAALVVTLLGAAGVLRVWMENQVARRNLAQAFLEKAGAAGRDLQWVRAAAYAAAARVEDETAEARWRTAWRGALEIVPLLRLQLGGPVEAVAAAPDGKTVAVAVTGQGVLVLETATGKQLLELEGQEGVVSALAFSPDGSQIASGVKDGVTVWGASSGDAVARLQAQGPVMQLSFSSDGTRLATAEDAVARIYDTQGFKLLQRIEGNEGQVTAVSFSSDGKLLAIGGQDGTIRTAGPLPEQGSARLDQRLIRGTGHQAVSRLGFAPSGHVLVSGSADATVRFFDGDSGAQLGRVNGNQGPIQTLAMSGEGTFAVLGQDSSVLLADFSTQGAVARLEGDDWSSAVALSADATLIASANREGKLRLWRVSPGDRITGLPAPKGFLGGTAIAFAPSSKRVATGDVAGHVVLWDVGTGKLSLALELPQGPVSSLSFSPDGKLLAAGGGEDVVHLFDVASGTRIPLEGHSGPVTAVAFSPDGRTLASTGQDGTVHLWDAPGGKPRATLTPSGSQTPLQALAISVDGKYVAAGGDDKVIRIWDVASKKQVRKLEGSPDGILSLAFSPHGTLLASAGKDQAIRVWRVANGDLRSTWSGHGGRIWSISFAPDGETLASASIDGTIRLWDVRTGRQVVRFDRAPDAKALAFSKDGHLLASTGERPAVQLIELDDKARLLDPQPELERQLKKGKLKLDGISLVDDVDALAPPKSGKKH